MQDILEWLIETEERAESFYTDASALFTEDIELSKLLTQLAKDERAHADILTSISKSDASAQKSAVKLDKETRERSEEMFSRLEGLIKEDELNAESLLAAIVEVEYSEWNDLFIYIIKALKYQETDGPVAAMINAHKGRLLNYLEKQSGDKALVKKIRSFPDVWKEKILVIEDEESIVTILKYTLVEEGSVVTASNGAEALRLLKDDYFAAIITDMKMPVMNGIEFYQKAVKKYPGIAERILFFSSSFDHELIKFIEENNIKLIKKPSPIGEIKAAVRNILYR